MKLKTMITLTALALSSAGYVQAGEASAPVVSAVATAGAASTANEVYEGVDTAGRRIRLTISEGGPEVLVRVDRQPALPVAHWTSLIGTGGAASAER